ncbi:MAG TPA: carboxymuconolactone decarboxylase family protein [Acetobacteraceae bacterium]|nr:carboxymuconolactone decarboxylase family protein [Acetobacteraceae bacterium]
MTHVNAQQQLRDQFVQAHGYWNPLWEPVPQALPEQFAAYVAFSAVPYRSGKLSPKVRELISIAVNVSMTLMNEPAVRVHVRNALRLGATREEILEVFGICSVLGAHSVNYPLGLLIKEMERNGDSIDLKFSSRAKEVQKSWIKKRGHWPSSFDSLLALDPEFVSAYSNFSDAPRIDGPLDKKPSN